MADTVRRKHMVYPESDSNQPKDDQFTTKPNLPVSTASSSEGVSNTKLRVGRQATNNTPIQVFTGDGFSSDDSEDSSPVIIPSEESTYGHSRLVATDKRVQSTYSLFGKGKLRSNRHEGNSLKLQQKEPVVKNMDGVNSPQNSPSTLRPTSVVKLRSTSPDVGRRIQSNPFLIQDRDRLSFSHSEVRKHSFGYVTAEKKVRRESVPAKHSPKEIESSEADRSCITNQFKRRTLKSESSDAFDAVSPRDLRASSFDPQLPVGEKFKGFTNGKTPSVSRQASIRVDIRNRIKLWAEKETNAQQNVKDGKTNGTVGGLKQKKQCTALRENDVAIDENLTEELSHKLQVPDNFEVADKGASKDEQMSKYEHANVQNNGVESSETKTEQMSKYEHANVQDNCVESLETKAEQMSKYEHANVQDNCVESLETKTEQMSKYEHASVQNNCVESLETKAVGNNDLHASTSSSPSTPTKNIHSENTSPLDKAVSVNIERNESDESIPITSSSSRTPVKESHSRTSSNDSSNERSSDLELTPKRSRWKLRSPLRSRKRNTDSETGSVDGVQSDDNVLSNNTNSPKHSKKKQKYVKKRLGDTISSMFSNESKQEKKSKKNREVPSANLLEVIPRSYSLGAQSKIHLIVNQGRRVSEPEIDKAYFELAQTDRGSQEDVDDTQVSRSETLNSESEMFTNIETSGNLGDLESEVRTMIVELELDDVAELPSVFVREKKGRGTLTSMNRTISRDLHDIINSFGTVGIDHNNSEISQTLVSEEAVVEESFQLEYSLSPNSSLNVFVEPPTDKLPLSNVPPRASSPNMLYLSGDSGSEEEGDTNTAQGDCCPIESSLDFAKNRRQRLLIKRRRSDSSQAIMNTKLNAYKVRSGSLSPTPGDPTDGVIATALMYADAVWDRAAHEDDELSFRVGEAIEILDMTDDVWWYGSVDAANGWFPASFVRLRIGQDSDEDNDSVNSIDPNSSPPLPEKHASSPTPPPPKKEMPKTSAEEQVLELSSKAAVIRRNTSSSRQQGTINRRMTIRRKDTAPSQPQKLSSDEVRAKVIEEILNTERDYVKHLEDIIEGYVKRCKGYDKLFDTEKCETIFSNIEDIFRFHKDFLGELELSVRHDHMEQSTIGEVFVSNRHQFDIYCQYCNNHPHAVNEMNLLQENEQYTFFFESCRLLRNLQDISLEGFLLTPVQKICKYPLQLTELLKYTSEDHPDYQHVIAARDAMKEVAMDINEQKRRLENIGKIGRWQDTIDGWKGEDILEKSTQLLYSGELHKISKGRSQERHFFLFDHQLVYCKKDTIGGRLTFKGRVCLDQCQIKDMEEGSATHSGSVVKNAWRMNNKAKENKWYIIFAKSPEEKRDWLNAFQKEREMVREDAEKRFYVSLKMKRAAVALCANADKLHRGRRKSIPAKSRAFVESMDSTSRRKADIFSSNTLGRKLAVSSGNSPVSPKRKLNFGRTSNKKKTS